MLGQDTKALEEAVGKLKDAARFNRGDAGVLNALGDALFALADLAAPASRRSLLEQALQEGFRAALHIDRNQSDALVGTAEVNLQLGHRECIPAPSFLPAKVSGISDPSLSY